MIERFLNTALDNNDIIFFNISDENGLDLWYSGKILSINKDDFDFVSIYGKKYNFQKDKVKNFKGPGILYEIDYEVSQTNKNRIYITFDTETNGLAKNYDAPMTDTNNWPKIIQIAWSLNDESGKEIEHKNILIKPDGFTIDKDSFEVHGITQEKAEKEGISLREALNIFSESVKKADVLVAHNISFDENVIGCEYFRIGMKNPMLDKKKICTMESSVDYCKIPSKSGKYAKPSLNRLYQILFQETFDNQHNASFDVKACARVFFELKRLGVIKI
jgi:DNA polymerase III epsilon subunit-like protein